MASILRSRLAIARLFSFLFALTASPAYISCWINCTAGSTFKVNSTYQSNLELLLPSLTSAASTSGFAVQSVGSPPDQVFGIAFCQGDLSVGECKSRLSDMVRDLRANCSFGKSAADWDDSYVRYSSTNFSSSDDDYYRQILIDEGDVGERDRFEDLVAGLMGGPGGLIDEAAYASDRKFAAGRTNYTSFVNVYGLVQCTRNQPAGSCSQCLQASMSRMQNCCWGRQGAVVMAYKCYLRFAIYPFFNETAVAEATGRPVPSPVATLPTTTSGNQPSEKDNGIRVALIAVLVPCGFVLLAVIFICSLKRKRFTWLIGLVRGVRDVEKQFDLSALKEATHNFSNLNKLDEGRFWSVYKGLLPDGTEVALKRLSKEGYLELRNEVMLVSKLQHKNLIRLLGCCSEEEEKILVYEFAPNSSLDKHLFDANVELDWDKRYKIIVGIAKGLQYLHEDCGIKIVHRDLKPSNILLDEELNPKIINFGLPKLMNLDTTKGSASQFIGTIGYIAPEYAFEGRSSTKSDVYSYGVLVLEILTGRKASDFHGSGNVPNLLTYAWNHWKTGKAWEIFDGRLGERYSKKEALRCLHIALLCVQKNTIDRPSMASVVLMLSSEFITLSFPSEPHFFIQANETNRPIGSTGNGGRNSAYQISSPVSINDITISELEAR